MSDLGKLVADFREDASVRQTLAREKREHFLFVSLGAPASGLLMVLIATGGLTPFTWVLLAVTALLVFFVATSVVTLIGFDETLPGLRVFELGMALPWRNRMVASRGEENVALFRDIAEIRILGGNAKPYYVVTWKPERRPRSFILESKWVPNPSAFLRALEGRVAIRQA